MFAFTNEERVFLTAERHAIVNDARGKERLAGLSEEETERYMKYVRLRRTLVDPDALGQFVALHQKHETVRRRLVSSYVPDRP